ncbi:MAG: chemotaxis protein CheW [Synergistaceae bacterium]|jgi:purine-binding chemotaxis protein CheW|nr:chemotaxis protein CheW [Synergistaceae bacterium]
MSILETSEKEQMTLDAETRGKERIILVFDLNEEFYGLDVNLVREIVRVPGRITRVPKAPGYIRGVINLRGTVIPVLDMSIKMGRESSEADSDSRIVVAEFEDLNLGVMVDAVREVRTIYEAEIESADRVETSADAEYLEGVAKIDDGRLICLLDLPRLLDIREIIEGEEEK